MFLSLFAATRKVARRGSARFPLSFETLESRWVLSTAYLAADLVSDQPGVAPVLDPNLVNAWGIAVNPKGAFWVSAADADRSMLYTGDVNGHPIAKASLEVSIPGGAPTGQVFNSTSDFVVSSGAASGPAAFIFASESGNVTGWNPGVPPPSTSAQTGYHATDGAIYKGIALANNGSANFLYVADFHNGKIDVLDSTFQKTTLDGSFTDPSLPSGYAPFNIAAIGGKLYVSYAVQDKDAEDDVAGHGRGLIDVFDTNGHFQQRLVTGGELNSPWGMALAPAGFGDFSGQLLVGNFGDGRIHAYDPTTGAAKGTLTESPGHPVVIDGLWGLAFGNGVSSGGATTLYYSAGPDHEAHGLFGKITANAAGTKPVQAAIVNGDLVITGSRDSDHVDVRLDGKGQHILVDAGGHSIGSFDLAAVGTIQFNGLAGDDMVVVNPRIQLTTILNGGAGNDLLEGGQGNNILLGGTGNDTLLGHRGRDLLIGGDGKDLLRGESNDDLLIGGSTNYDDNDASLLQILAAWTSTDSYNTRVDKLRNGTGGVPALNSTTVTDDHTRDILSGGPGLDWFFAFGDDLTPGRLHSENIN